MASEKKSDSALVMTYRKMLSDIEGNISQLKERNPDLLNYEEAKQIQEKYIAKKEEFTNKHKLEVKENPTDKKLVFISKEKDIQIEISKEKISGQWSNEKESTAIPIMVELYLKSIENQKVDKHKVEGKNPEVTKQIEIELAKKLKEKGIHEVNVNDKNIQQILNSNIQTSKAL